MKDKRVVEAGMGGYPRAPLQRGNKGLVEGSYLEIPFRGPRFPSSRATT